MNPVLLLHGALGSKTQLDPLKSELEKKGRHVFSMNFSGHSGEPFRKQFGIGAFADDITIFLDAHNLSQVDIFGYSMGGYVALWFAHLHPQRVGRIVTLGTKFDWSVASAEKETRKLNAQKIEEKVPAFARILQSRHAPNDWKELLARTAEMMKKLGEHPLLTRNIFASINHTVTVLLGDQDDIADRDFSQEVASMLPDGKFELLTETPHPIEKVKLAAISALF
jgi:pimeloyl-ACP methyl ester carboxylesterase